jgi:hypothetical protein
MDWKTADTLPETPVSEELFESWYTTRELAYQLRASIASQPFGRKAADTMWAEYEAGEAAKKAGKSVAGPFWYRGIVCRALAHLGTDLHKINFRKS